ncbi:pectin lyase-like superfamily protein [Actinidia rufa]|uniref:Pectate lyase n=1 Tax=Actinidia rufa TaxID=165716 RepID=A0A7J0DB61_9ERIC|nr:pectin lyase-like superfamily protein [Actinidia rufa]
MDTPYELQSGLGLATGLGFIQVGLDSSRWAGLNTNIIIHGIHIHDCKPGGYANISDSPRYSGRWTPSDDDGISIFASSQVWLDHCSLSNCHDGLIDAIHGSTAITISNNYMTHHDKVMLLGHIDWYAQDKNMQVTIAFNHFGEGLVQRMPRCRHGYFHVVNNDYTHWKMYAIGGSANPTINSQDNRFFPPNFRFKKEVTKMRMHPRVSGGTRDGNGASLGRGRGSAGQIAIPRRHWNWRSEGDLMLNRAYFGQLWSGASPTYARASSLSARPSSFVGPMTTTAGALNYRKGSRC